MDPARTAYIYFGEALGELADRVAALERDRETDMARRKPATINDDFEAVFEKPSSPRPLGEGSGVRAVPLTRMCRDAKPGEPATAEVHPDEVERWRARGWKLVEGPA